MLRSPRVVFVLILGLLILVYCNRSNKVLVNELKTLADGERWTLKLDPGTYKLEITASDDGASVEWVGSDCPGCSQTGSFTTVCRFLHTGQIIISNPTTLGLGSPVSVTIKLTKLARNI